MNVLLVKDLTPEALAAVSAKYSRSNKGIKEIIATIDPNDYEGSVAKIFRFIDFGHRSIAGMSGSLTIALDGISMYMAYFIFANCPLANGMESSTRYIKIDESGVMSPEEIGIPDSLCDSWSSFTRESIRLYNKYHDIFSSDTFKNERETILKNTKNEQASQRLIKNFALDRCRRFVPFAMKTNMVISMTIKEWGDLLCILDSMNTIEASELREKIVKEIYKECPNLFKHYAATKSHTQKMIAFYNNIKIFEYPHFSEDKIKIVFDGFGENMGNATISHYDDDRTKYDPIPEMYGSYVLRYKTSVCIAELRDINRHRTGYKHSSLSWLGYSTPMEYTDLSDWEVATHITNLKGIIFDMKNTNKRLIPYCYTLGVITDFSRVVFGNHFLYEYQLRTGSGSHFEYRKLYENMLGELKLKYWAEPYLKLFNENEKE